MPTVSTLGDLTRLPYLLLIGTYMGLVGLLYVGWLTVPIGAIVGAVAFVGLDAQLTKPSGKFWAMAISAAAGMVFVGGVNRWGIAPRSPLPTRWQPFPRNALDLPAPYS